MTAEVREGLRFSTDHCWARIEDTGEVTIGLTDFVQAALGAIVFANLPEVGMTVEEGATIGEVESTKAVSEIYAPIAGAVAKINSDLLDAPGRLNTDPYGTGWICTLESADSDEFSRLLDASAYAALTNTAAESEPSTKD